MATRATSGTGARTRTGRRNQFIVRLDTFEGADTACYLFGADLITGRRGCGVMPG